MAELKTKIIWQKTLLEMKIGETLEIPFDEKDLCSASANYQKSRGIGEWKISSNRDLKQAFVERIK
jgi:hypothetical protein